MKNAYYEESAVAINSAKQAKYYMAFLVLSLIFFVIAGIIIFFSFSYVPNMIQTLTGGVLTFTLVTWFGGIAVLLAVGFIFWRIKRRFNVSYDYTFVEDELRITKVFNGRKRRVIAIVQADFILKIGYYDKPSYLSTLAGMGEKKAKILTPNREPAEDKIFIYMLVSSSIEKGLYVLECRRILLEYLVRAAGVNKFERE